MEPFSVRDVEVLRTVLADVSVPAMLADASGAVVFANGAWRAAYGDWVPRMGPDGLAAGSVRAGDPPGAWRTQLVLPVEAGARYRVVLHGPDTGEAPAGLARVGWRDQGSGLPNRSWVEALVDRYLGEGTALVVALLGFDPPGPPAALGEAARPWVDHVAAWDENRRVLVFVGRSPTHVRQAVNALHRTSRASRARAVLGVVNVRGLDDPRHWPFALERAWLLAWLETRHGGNGLHMIALSRARTTRGSAYGSRAIRALTAWGPHASGAAADFVRRFYAGLAKSPEMRRVFEGLTAAEFRALKAAQAQHLMTLLDPRLNAEEHQRQAVALGERHALSGVTGPFVTQAMMLYQTLVLALLHNAGLPPAQLEEARTVVALRVSNELGWQLEGIDRVSRLLAAALGDVMEGTGRVATVDEAAGVALQRLMTLPGFVAGAFGWPRPRNGELTFSVEVGRFAAYRAGWGPGGIRLSGTRGRGPVGEAWRREQVVTSANVARDPRMAPWRQAAESVGIRSTAAVPVADPGGRLIGVLLVYGAYVNQFETPMVRQFLAAVARLVGSRAASRGIAVPRPALGERQATRAHLARGGLTFWYQPIVDLRTGRFVGAEALARLRAGPDRLLLPGEFLPLLGTPELHRLLVEAVRDAGRTYRRLAERDRPGFVAVNVPPEVLQDPDAVGDLWSAWGGDALPASGLVLELVEAASVDPAVEETRMEALDRRGIRWALDDLGAGYANLERLVTRPWTFVKVDQMLWARVAADPLRLLPLLGRTADMAHGLGYRVVAEGLETPALLDAAQALGFDWAQGYGLARPMPADALLEWAVPAAAVPEPGTTALGTLAIHWRALQESGAAHPACLETPFFQAHPRLRRQHRSAHDHVHDRRLMAAAEATLAAWVRREATVSSALGPS